MLVKKNFVIRIYFEAYKNSIVSKNKAANKKSYKAKDNNINALFCRHLISI